MTHLRTLALASALAFTYSLPSIAIEKSESYVSFETFTGKGDFKLVETYESEKYSNSANADPTGASLILGMKSKSKSRYEIQYTYIEISFEDNPDADSGDTIDIQGLDFNAAFPFADNKVISPYLLVGFGIYNWQESKDSFSEGVDELTGVAYNLGLGTSVKLGEPYELDISYRYKNIDWETIKDSDGVDADYSNTMRHIQVGARMYF